MIIKYCIIRGVSFSKSVKILGAKGWKEPQKEEGEGILWIGSELKVHLYVGLESLNVIYHRKDGQTFVRLVSNLILKEY